jgi:hypothetical protein
MKRNTILAGAILALVIIVSISFAPKVWIAVSVDGAGPAAGEAQEPVGFATTTWKSLSGGFVDESAALYSSPDVARTAFAEYLNGGGRIVSSEADRIVKAFGEADPDREAVMIITVRDKEVHCVNAGSLRYALAFEGARLKL